MQEEKIVIERVKSGDRLAFKEIVESHKKMVYYLAYDLTGNHQDAEDLSQEAFIKMYNSISKFRGEAKLATWLKKIIINLYIDMRRSKHYKTRQLQDMLEEKHLSIKSKQHKSVENNADNNLLKTKIEAAMHKLSPKEKSIFVMKHFHGMKNSEIGESLNIAVGTVKSLLYRAIQKLQLQLAPIRQEFGLEDS